jgi:ketosteroid isomerase-like protein
MTLSHVATRFFLLALISTGPTALRAQDTAPIAAINHTLDQLHDAASKADGARYFKLFTDDAVYIGTDAAERWTIAQFRAYAEPYFAKGTGWTYKPRSRHVIVADIPCHCIAWFDELLDSQSYGTSRGTGVLALENGSWKIKQYALTFPIPNDLAKGMTNDIKAFEAKKKP